MYDLKGGYVTLKEVFDKLSDDQIMSLIIGFIDGDGYIQLSSNKNGYNRIKINLEVHS